MTTEHHQPIGASLPEGARFIGRPDGANSAWPLPGAPAAADLDSCVACGLCLPHCPTYRLTGEESASPRGRIAAMRAVEEGFSEVDDVFRSFMDECLVCRACEDVCPSHVPFGRMMEAARTQIEPLRPKAELRLRRLALGHVLTRGWLLRAVTLFQPLAKPFMPRRLRDLMPGKTSPLARLPRSTEPPQGVNVRGTVALLSGCVQDRWFHEVNLATIRVLARSGWKVVVPKGQSCCGALAAHNGQMETAEDLAARNASAFAGADHVIVNASGCSAHMKSYADVKAGTDLPVSDLMEFLHEFGLGSGAASASTTTTTTTKVAYHDACHALRAQKIHHQPRALLSSLPGVEVVEIPDGDVCCGAAGIYKITEPEMADQLMTAKAKAVASTGATVVASANPGCSLQLKAGLKQLAGEAAAIQIVHPVQLIDRALSGRSAEEGR